MHYTEHDMVKGLLKPCSTALAAAAVKTVSQQRAHAQQIEFNLQTSHHAFGLLQELLSMRESDASAKALIFSSLQPTVDYLKEILPGWGFSFRYINGEGQQQRNYDKQQQANLVHF